MSPLISLTEEHQTIVGLLGALQACARRLESGVRVDPDDLGRFSEVLRELVDYRHHEKEEGILMPLLAHNGFEWSSGLLAELRFEHVHLRHLLEVLCQAAAKGSLGSREQRRQVVEAALAFVEAKREHVRKEDELLLPAVIRQLSSRALDQLCVELARFDRAAGRDSGGLLAGVTAELVQRYREDSGVVDVRGLPWAEAGRLHEVALAAAEGGRAAATSFARPR